MMLAILAHQVELDPTFAQANYFARACGTARFAWNWALAKWNELYTAGTKPNEAQLRKLLNAQKDAEFTWMREVASHPVKYAVKALGDAFKRFFTKKAKRPRFKKKGAHDSFRADNGEGLVVTPTHVNVPRLGLVRTKEALRFAGRIVQVVISRAADKWFASITVETEFTPIAAENQSAVGLDLGVTAMGTTDADVKYPAPKPLKQNLRRLKRLQRRVSRRVKGSKNRRKAQLAVAKLHYRIACIRSDAVHKMTSDLVAKYQTIAIEDLNVSGMVRNHCLARAISDVGFYEVRRQLEYKSKLHGRNLVVVDRFFPSSKLCSACGHKLDALPLKVREWACPNCNTVHDRDVNAAKNLVRQVLPEVTPAETGVPATIASLPPVVEAGIAPCLERA